MNEKIKVPHFTIKDTFNMNREMLSKITTLVETYLCEFCEVKGITENELKDLLMVASCPSDASILVVNKDDTRDVKFGVKVKHELTKVSIEVFGEYTEQSDDYPKTKELFSKING